MNEIIPDLNNPALITHGDILLRLLLGFAAGAIIGLERTSKRQTAGLKTHILISIGATLLMLLSIWMPQTFTGVKNGDPERIAAQVVSGIGFLGAGAMIRLGNNIKGLTTATSLWVSAALGLAIGAGMFFAAGIATGIVILTLIVVSRIEKKMFPSERSKVLILRYEARPDTEEVLGVLKKNGVRVHTFDYDDVDDGKETRLRILTGMPNKIDIARLVREVKASGKVVKFELKENY
jgi:putative Mg2+ transporter-C (MgtC) family protein